MLSQARFIAVVLLAIVFLPQVTGEADEEATCTVLYPGWNLVTYVGTNVPVSDALGTVEDDVTAVYYWTGNDWLGYFPGLSP